jgi:hypothetical protein
MQKAYSQGSILLKQADGLRVKYDATYRSTAKNFSNEEMDTWGIVVYIENLTNDVLTYNINWNFRKYPDYQLNPVKRWSMPYGDQEYAYSGQIGPREIVKKTALPQNTLSSCDNCIKTTRIKTWEVTNKSSQTRAVQEQQQQRQYESYQLEQKKLQEEASLGAILFLSDVQATIKVIGQGEFVLQPNVPQTFRFIKGEIIVDIIPTVAPDKVIREIISVVAGSQVVKNITLASQYGEAERQRVSAEKEIVAKKQADQQQNREANKSFLQFEGAWKGIGLLMDTTVVKSLAPIPTTITFYSNGIFILDRFLVYTTKNLDEGILDFGIPKRFEGNKWEAIPTDPNSIYLNAKSNGKDELLLVKRINDNTILVAYPYEGTTLYTFFSKGL